MKKGLKRIVATIACLSSCALVFAACGRTPSSKPNGDYDNDEFKTVELNLWVPSDSRNFYQDRVDEFLLNHTNCEINIYEKSASEVYGALKSDVSVGADVFMFTGEYAKELQKINALYKLPDNYASNVRGRDNAYTMAPIESGNGLYGFPTTLDNGWYLWYNAAFYNDSEVDSLDDILIKARDMNKKVRYMFSSFWYATAFFNGMGCQMDYKADGTYYTDIDSDAGKSAAQAMYKYGFEYGSVLVPDYDDATVRKLNSGETVAAFGGAWMGAQLNDNIFPAVCPQFSIDDYTSARMRPYVDGSYFGVNAQRKNKNLAIELADFLSDEQSQVARYNELKTIPSNKNAISRFGASDRAVSMMSMQCEMGATHLYRHPETAYSMITDYTSACIGHLYPLYQMIEELRYVAQTLNNL